MRKFGLILVLLLAAAQSTFAANWFVVKGASGTNAGTSWANAWNEMSSINFSSVACGDTIWLAGGTYTTAIPTISKNCTSGNILTIARVLSTDPVGTGFPGWSSAFDSQVILQNTTIEIGAGNYWTMDGRIGTVAGNNFGISLQITGSSGTGIDEADIGSAVTHVTFTHIELFGPPASGSGCGASQADGLNLRSFSVPTQNFVFDHGWIHRWNEAIRFLDQNNPTIQYTDVDTVFGCNPNEHADTIYSTGSNYTFRYNRVWNIDADGLFFDQGSPGPVLIYGNVFWDNRGSILDIFNGGTNSGITLYNNVFADNGGGSFIYIQTALPGGAFENNVFYSVGLNGSPPSTSDYNAWTGSKGDSGTHSFVFTAGSQFVSFVASSSADFHLTSTGETTFQNGLSLASPYNMDPDGNTRGATGHWYIGQFDIPNSGSQAMAPSCAPGTGTYTSAQTVTCTNPNTGTTVACYTLNGTTPATNGAGTACTTGTKYTTTITVSASETLIIIAGTSTLTDSPTVTYVYTIDVATPTFNPPAGTYPLPQNVAISTATAGAAICYTTDGSTPTATTPGTCSHGTTYSAPIPVSTTVTIQAIGTLSGDTNSSVASGTYTITPAAPSAKMFALL